MSTGLPGDETNQPAEPQQPMYGGAAGTPPPPPPPLGGTGEPVGGYAQPSTPTTGMAGSTGSSYGTAPSGNGTSASKATTSFDPKSVSTPEWLVIGGAVVFLIAMLLPWLNVSFGDGLPGVGLSESANGFEFGLLVFALLLLLAAAVWLLLRHFGVRMELPVSRAIVALGLTALALLFVVIKFLDVLTSGGEFEASGVDVGAGFGAYIGLLAALAAVAGAVMLFQAERRTGPTT